MQVNTNYQSALDYIFGRVDSIHEQTYESNIRLTKTASVKSIEAKSEKKLPVPRQRLKEKSRLLPTKAIDIMTQWYDKHYESPYPSFRECEQMANDGCISINQVKQWFVNVRRRTQNKNRITREHRSTQQVTEYDYRTNLNSPTKKENAHTYYYQNLTNLTNTTLNTYTEERKLPTSYEPSCWWPNVYHSQIQTTPSSYQHSYASNYPISPFLTNYTGNYTSINPAQFDASSSSSVYSSPSTYSYASSSFGDSYTTESSNNSLDYSSPPRITQLDRF